MSDQVKVIFLRQDNTPISREYNSAQLQGIIISKEIKIGCYKYIIDKAWFDFDRVSLVIELI